MKLYSETQPLTPRPPFDFAQSLAFLGLFTPMRGEQALSAQTLTKAISIEGRAVVFEVRSKGTLDRPRLDCTLYSDRPISAQLKAAALDRVTFFLSLEDDLRSFYAVGQADEAFAPIVQQLYGYHQVKFLTPFENACWAVLTQRNWLDIARRMKDRLVEELGDSLTVNGTLYRAFPAPDRLTALPAEALAAMIRNEPKARYLGEVARAFVTVDEQFLRTGDYVEVEAWLRQIKGIGPWSATFVLLRGLGRMEQVPLSEKNLLEAASRVYGHVVTADSICSIAERYGRWQGYWAHYLRVIAV